MNNTEMLSKILDELTARCDRGEITQEKADELYTEAQQKYGDVEARDFNTENPNDGSESSASTKNSVTPSVNANNEVSKELEEPEGTKENKPAQIANNADSTKTKLDNAEDKLPDPVKGDMEKVKTEATDRIDSADSYDEVALSIEEKKCEVYESFFSSDITKEEKETSIAALEASYDSIPDTLVSESTDEAPLSGYDKLVYFSSAIYEAADENLITVDDVKNLVTEEFVNICMLEDSGYTVEATAVQSTVEQKLRQKIADIKKKLKGTNDPAEKTELKNQLNAAINDLNNIVAPKISQKDFDTEGDKNRK